MESGITGKPGTKIAVEHEHFRAGVRVLLWNDDCYYRCTFEQVPHQVEQVVPADESFLQFSIEEAQALCQALADAGFKPNAGEGTPGHIASMKAHITDLQGMVSIEGAHVQRLLNAVTPAPPPPIIEDAGGGDE